MKIVEQIKAPILLEMETFEKKFSNSMTSKVPLLNRITHYIVNRKGKQMRPMFVFLVAKMLSENSPVNALWKNKIAVLVGDYLLSKGLLLSIDNEDFDLLKIISVAVREMSEGELLQIEKARKLDISEDVYYEIIRQKTATLIAACCSLGAASVKPDSEDVETLRKFGELIGMAFQIKDDLFDYGDTAIGKPTGIDIKEQKMTLPLIYALNNATKKDKAWIINSIKNHNKNKTRVKQVIAKVKELKGLEYATERMLDYKNEALAILSNYPDSEYKLSLETMVSYVIDRKK